MSHRLVIKASCIAAGKGAILPETTEETLLALSELMLGNKFGEAGKRVVIKEFLEGEEMSNLTFSDGKTLKSMFPAQDHKRAFDGDKGPNISGMGFYAPTRIATPALLKHIEEKILEPTFEGTRREGTPFVGCLFIGVMLTRDGPKTLEYNARFGDPDTQKLLTLIKTDLAEIMVACTEGRLHEVGVEMEDKSCAAAVLSSGGYPRDYEKGITIRRKSLWMSMRGELYSFHAGTKRLENGNLVAAGGRVMAVSATAPTLKEAVANAYNVCRS